MTGDVFRARQGSLDTHLPRLDAEWAAGCHNGAELWRRLRASGFTGSLRVVGEWATRRRRSERAPEGSPAIVAVGVNSDGRRKVLGMDVGPS